MNAARLVGTDGRRIAADLRQAFENGGTEGFFDRHAPGEAHAACRHRAGVGDAVRRPIGANDMMIAGIALAEDLTLVTRNTEEFRRITGMRIEVW